jgi:quinolinate synthase
MYTELQHRILELKKKKRAVILAHYYQESQIQDIADFVGDSLGLSRQAANTDAEIIVFAGVHFMAETAKILNPSKKVLLPDLNAGCSLADGCPPDRFRRFLDQHPHHVVVSYINCSAEVKAMSDIICTSANAVKVIQSIPAEDPVIFAPDKNLGRYLELKTGRKLVLWDGGCEVHEAFSLEKLKVLQAKHPEAKLLVHPESESFMLMRAHYIGSTTAMIKFAKEDPASTYIIATEAGILHRMRLEAPGKTFIPAPAKENNTCACSECRYMKMNTLEKVYQCLLLESPEINISAELREKAKLPIERMLRLSESTLKNPSFVYTAH